MKHKVKVTVIDKKLYPELQREYCADPNAGACPCYHVGDEFIFYRGDTCQNKRRPGYGRWWPQNPLLLRSLGCDCPLSLYGVAGRFHYERLDERRKCNDSLLL